MIPVRSNEWQNPQATGGIPIERLERSYRFDQELATFLTEFQYNDDGIQLTSEANRSIPETTHRGVTDGVEAVFAANTSIVLVCYDADGYQMVNPIEKHLATALAEAITMPAGEWDLKTDGGTSGPLAEAPGLNQSDRRAPQPRLTMGNDRLQPPRDDPLSVGIVTPHNAQRGALETAVPNGVDVNTVEKFQGGERDVMVVSATVADAEFGRQEDRFILDPRRLLVAISRARYLSIVVCSTELFEVVPEDAGRLDDGPLWARLYTLIAGREHTPSWSGPLAEFTSSSPLEHAEVPVRVYPNSLNR